MRKIFSEQEKQEIIRKYKEFGKSAAQFGRDNDISAINILRWIKKKEDNTNNTTKEEDSNFVEIKKSNYIRWHQQNEYGLIFSTYIII